MTDMSFVAVNYTNAFDLINAKPFASFEEADAAAREALLDAPKATIKVLEIKQVYTATVTVSSANPEPVEPAPQE
ncbi:hypothetical protein HOV23_gp021 [Pseudomonas phage Lana]|uniref:Uncharacterized protein n=1 Tax=Pseudomonas phage Lana TaxID=2530172 RepID=A0A481W805_9CAUD|nr:hypothetical protein HOV23_gp021 [Pseudomonas phage Lana]QBJ04552.1 hypothetical protein [Pseudomonas phage Lana]